MSRSVPYLMLCSAVGAGAASMLRESTPAEPPKPRLLDRVRETLRLRRYSRRTEQAYAAWIRHYILFHGKRHPTELGPADLTAFLSSLAVEGHVAASTQNQALSALLFLYRDVLETIWSGWTASCARSGRSGYPSCSPATKCWQCFVS